MFLLRVIKIPTTLKLSIQLVAIIFLPAMLRATSLFKIWRDPKDQQYSNSQVLKLLLPTQEVNQLNNLLIDQEEAISLNSIALDPNHKLPDLLTISTLNRGPDPALHKLKEIQIRSSMIMVRNPLKNKLRATTMTVATQTGGSKNDYFCYLIADSSQLPKIWISFLDV